MKKNKAMRLASALLVLTLLTTCAISSTFAKYVTEAKGSDTARVARWGFTQEGTTIVLDDLFKTAYDQNVQGVADVIAPGTTNSVTFGFTYAGTYGSAVPEVAYTFTVSTEGSECADSIKRNRNIQWRLDDDGAWGTWDNMIAAIETLDGDKPNNRYEPQELPDEFKNAGTHTISWRWLFDGTTTIDGGIKAPDNDTDDTTMGNKAELDKVILKITVTATQID